MIVSQGRLFWAESMAVAQDLRWEHAWHVAVTVKTPVLLEHNR